MQYDKDVAMNIPSLAGRQRWRALQRLAYWLAQRRALKLQQPALKPLRAWESLAEQHGQRITLPDGLSALRWPIHLGPQRGRVLLLHDWGARATHWYGFIPMLQARGIETIALDLPGHGRSRPISNPYPHCQMQPLLVSQLHQAIEYFGPFDGVLGHGLSAYVMTVAAQQLASIPRLVLLAPVHHWSSLFHLELTSDTPASLRSLVLAELEQSAYFCGLDSMPLSLSRPNNEALIVQIQDQTRNTQTRHSRWAFTWPQVQFWQPNEFDSRKIMHSAEVHFRVAEFLSTSLFANKASE